MSPDIRIGRRSVVEAILNLQKDPRPADNPALKYVDTEGGPMEVLLRFLPGIPFIGGREVFREDLRARHHITVEGVTVVYALNERETRAAESLRGFAS